MRRVREFIQRNWKGAAITLGSLTGIVAAGIALGIGIALVTGVPLP